MPRFFNKFFNENSVVSKAVSRFISARCKTLMGLFVVEGYPQSFAATASTGLDHHWVANAFSNLNGFFGTLDSFIDTRNGVDFCKRSQFFRGDFVAHGCNCFMFGADKNDGILFTLPRKIFVFTEETIARVNGLCTCFFGSSNNHFAQEIAFTARRWANAH